MLSTPVLLYCMAFVPVLASSETKMTAEEMPVQWEDRSVNRSEPDL